MSDRDPIVAIATAPGRGGIGIVRISGANLQPIVRALLGAQAERLVPRHALLTPFRDAAGSFSNLSCAATVHITFSSLLCQTSA